MSNLTNRSKLFLKKKKAQYGDFIRDSISYIDPDVFSQKPLYSQKQKEQPSFIDSLPVIGSIGQIIGGIAGIFEGNRQERIQNIHESASAADLQQRREKARANNFYITPYTTGRTDNLTAKKGLNVPFYQNGGQMDLFMDFYNQQEQSSKMLQKHLSDIYKDKNEKLEQEANNTKKDAFGSIFEGATGLLGFLQKGGIIPESTFVKPVATNKLDHLIIPDRVKREDARVEFFGRENPAKIDPLQQAYIKDTIMPNVEAYKDYKKEMYGADSQKLTTLRDRDWQQRRQRDNWVRERQEGGEIEAPDTESLYSSDFQSPVEDQGFSENEIQNFLTSTSPGEEMQKNSNLLSWLFEEEPLDTHTTNDIYHFTYGQDTSNVSTEIPVKPLVDQFSSMGINVGSINTGTHNHGSKHYSGKAFDIPASKNGGKQGLYRIYNYLNSPEGKKQFPNIKVINEIEKPAGKIGDANHLHIELLD